MAPARWVVRAPEHIAPSLEAKMAAERSEGQARGSYGMIHMVCCVGEGQARGQNDPTSAQTWALFGTREGQARGQNDPTSAPTSR